MNIKPSDATIQVAHDGIIDGRFKWIRGTSWSMDPKITADLDALVTNRLAYIAQRDDMRNPQLSVILRFELPVDNLAGARYYASCDWTDVGPEPEPDEPMVAVVPGKMYATYENGQITKVSFSPAAAQPDYQGPSFLIDQGECPDEEDDRPFWFAMADYLSHANPDWEG